MEKLKREDEVTVMELLQISSEELVDRFQDKVEDKLQYLEHELND